MRFARVDVKGCGAIAPPGPGTRQWQSKGVHGGPQVPSRRKLALRMQYPCLPFCALSTSGLAPSWRQPAGASWPRAGLQLAWRQPQTDPWRVGRRPAGDLRSPGNAKKYVNSHFLHFPEIPGNAKNM